MQNTTIETAETNFGGYEHNQQLPKINNMRTTQLYNINNIKKKK